MELFLLTRKDDVDYDEVESFVIRAESGVIARGMADNESGDEGRIWSDTAKVDCVSLTNDGEETIIVRNYHPG